MIIPKPKQIISSKAVLDSVAGLPRYHIGDVVYDPILKPARAQDPRTGRPPRHGYSSTPRPLPWDLIKDRQNCTLTVKIGKEHLAPDVREEITSRRAVWGTDIYTDDSDVIAACIHAGWIRGEWPEDIDIEALGLDEGANNPDNDAQEGNNRKAGSNKNASRPTNPDVLSEPPRTGPVPVPENRDLHVTLLILPLLQKYASTVRFGIKSREFGGLLGDAAGPHQRAVHDGLSFMIKGIRWVTNGAGGQNRLRGKARRERIRRALREVELGPAWAGASPNVVDINGAAAAAAPSQTKGNHGAEGGELRKPPEKAPSEGDKENLPADEDRGGNQEREASPSRVAADAGEKMAVDEPEQQGEEGRAPGSALRSEAGAEEGKPSSAA